MSLEEIREQNKIKVIEVALNCFVNNGIENTKISDIAKIAGLTQRSVYRYFETKADLVLASAMLFWSKTVDASEKAYKKSQIDQLNGAMQIEAILNAYAKQYFVDSKKLIFIQEAEVFLYRSGMVSLVSSTPPETFEEMVAPLSKAISKGLQDGSVKNKEKAIRSYYNAYDSLLGLMQKMATRENEQSDKEETRQRLQEFCKLLTDDICG